MKSDACPHARSLSKQRHPAAPVGRRLTFWQRWVLANSLIAGVLALVWLVLRRHNALQAD